MSRYFSRPPAGPKAIGWVEDEFVRTGWRHVSPPAVSDHVARDTGLLDRDGYPIMRAPNPIGFIWDN